MSTQPVGDRFSERHEDTNVPRIENPRTTPVSIAGLAGEADPKGLGVREPSLRTIGRTIAGWIIILITVILGLVSLFAWFTYPHIHDMAGITEAGRELESYREYQMAWFGQIKDLLQLLVVSLLVPLFSTVVGYIFGRQMEARS
jgi:hypothetical protein